MEGTILCEPQLCRPPRSWRWARRSLDSRQDRLLRHQNDRGSMIPRGLRRRFSNAA
jgi:hypothetical protein